MPLRTRLTIALLLNFGIVAAQAVAGFRAHSVGLLADAGHNLVDGAGLGLSLLAVHLTRKPPTPQRSFGYQRSTVIAAQANAGARPVPTTSPDAPWTRLHGRRSPFVTPRVDVLPAPSGG